MNENPIVILDFYYMKPTIKCKHCNKEFTPARYGVQKFCSASCRVSNWQMNKRINLIKNSKPKNELSIAGPTKTITPAESKKSLLANGLVNLSAIGVNETAKRLGVYKTKETTQLEEMNKKQDELNKKIDELQQQLKQLAQEIKPQKAINLFKDSL